MAASAPRANGAPPTPIGVSLGNGNGTFKAPLRTTTNGHVLAVADFNRDGKADLLAVSDVAPKETLILLGNGNGTFTTRTVFKVVGRGNDFWGTGDQGDLVWTQLDGDATISARVLSIQNTNAWAKAGVMIRETLYGDSKQADSDRVAVERRDHAVPRADRWPDRQRGAVGHGDRPDPGRRARLGPLDSDRQPLHR